MRLLPKTVLFLLVLLAVPAFPYGLQFSDSGRSQPLRWAGGKITLSLSTSFSASRNVIEAKAVFDSLKRASSRWKEAGSPDFEIVSTNDSSISPPGKSGDGVSLVTIAQTTENLLLFSGRNSGSPAFTRIFFDRRGRITEADIVLNPYFLHSTDSTPGTFDIESTFVHEIGHLLGLGHSDLPGASMNEKAGKNGLFGVPFTMFRSLSEDDKAGIRTLYPEIESGGACCGVIEGRIAFEPRSNGNVIVWAEEEDTGRVLAIVRADDDGRFAMGGLSDDPMVRLFMKELGTRKSGTHLLGVFDVTHGKITDLGELRQTPADSFRIEQVGFNGELTDIAVPLNDGNTYRVYVAGTGDVEGIRFEISSPHAVTDDSSYELSNYGTDLKVISFLVEISDDVPSGTYSIQAFRDKTLIDSMAGAVSIGEDRNPWIFHRLP